MKAGKTWAAMDLMLSIALGEKWLGAFDNTMGGPAACSASSSRTTTAASASGCGSCAAAAGITPNDARLTRT
jgi:RecA-family ATPase